MLGEKIYTLNINNRSIDVKIDLDKYEDGSTKITLVPLDGRILPLMITLFVGVNIDEEYAYINNIDFTNIEEFLTTNNLATETGVYLEAQNSVMLPYFKLNINNLRE